jgi:hypothetical protein
VQSFVAGKWDEGVGGEELKRESHSYVKTKRDPGHSYT